MSGVDIDGPHSQKRRCWRCSRVCRRSLADSVEDAVTRVSTAGGTALVVAENDKALGVVHLKDIVKGGLKDRFRAFPCHGDQNRHDHRRQSVDRRGHRRRSRCGRLPGRSQTEDKLALIRKEQAAGHLWQ